MQDLRRRRHTGSGVWFVSSSSISEVFARAGVEPEVVAKWVGMPLSLGEDVFVYEVQTR